MDEKTIARFWSKVDRNGPTLREGLGPCWVWTAGRGHWGYGKFTDTHMAHRLAFQLVKGPINDGLWVLHKCDYSSCCNPEHLFLGTHQDNVDDKLQKGRQPRGESHGLSKLTEEQVRLIRALHASGEQQKRIARQFSLDITTVNDIVHRHTWKHVA